MSTVAMTAFGRRTAWFAFADVEPELVAAALRLTECTTATWPDAVGAASSAKTVTVTPPLRDRDRTWTLATGADLLDTSERVAALSAAVESEVQYFGTHEGAGWHAWGRARDGRVVREFAWLASSGVLRWVGTCDSTELALGLPTTGASDDATTAYVSTLGLGDEHVLRLAAAWSLDPSRLGGGRPSPRRPIVGSYRLPPVR